FVVHGDDAELEQVRKQLGKIVTVVKVIDISTEDYVERDLMLIKVSSTPQQRTEIALLVEMFRGRVVDISPTTLMIEISGQEQKIGAFRARARLSGPGERARPGRVARARGPPGRGAVLWGRVCPPPPLPGGPPRRTWRGPAAPPRSARPTRSPRRRGRSRRR